MLAPVKEYTPQPLSGIMAITMTGMNTYHLFIDFILLYLPIQRPFADAEHSGGLFAVAAGDAEGFGHEEALELLEGLSDEAEHLHSSFGEGHLTHKVRRRLGGTRVTLLCKGFR